MRYKFVIQQSLSLPPFAYIGNISIKEHRQENHSFDATILIIIFVSGALSRSHQYRYQICDAGPFALIVKSRPNSLPLVGLMLLDIKYEYLRFSRPVAVFCF